MGKQKAIISAILLLSFACVFGQNSKTTSKPKQEKNDSVYVIKSYDDVSGKTFYYTSWDIVCLNPSKTKGFSLGVYIKDEMKFGFLTVKMAGIGGLCNEKDELIILFENGERIITKSWAEYNCKGDAYFYIDEVDIERLRKNPISKIRVTNGIDFDSYTAEIIKIDKRFFIQLFYCLDNKLAKVQN